MGRLDSHGEMAEWFKAAVLKFDVVSNGRVAERFKALVLKTSDGQPSVGSNPTPSANKNKNLDYFAISGGCSRNGIPNRGVLRLSVPHRCQRRKQGVSTSAKGAYGYIPSRTDLPQWSRGYNGCRSES